MPSKAELATLNVQLVEEIEAHRNTLAQLTAAHEQLELRVHERTRELAQAAEQSQGLLRELAHRSKNLLAVIIAMARQTQHQASSAGEFTRRFVARLEGVAQSHDLLFRENWQGVQLADLAHAQVFPFIGNRQANITGPDLSVSADVTQSLGMALHELATNSAKYGSLSVPDGRVDVRWRIEPSPGGERRFVMQWFEYDGPVVIAPSRFGWGTTVMRDLLVQVLDAHVNLDFAQDGLRWTLAAPIDANNRIG